MTPIDLEGLRALLDAHHAARKHGDIADTHAALHRALSPDVIDALLALAERALQQDARSAAQPAAAVAYRWRWTHEKWGPTSWLYQADRPRPISTADGYQFECDALGVIPAPPAAAVERGEG